ncbi:hypothetical protein EPA93_26665 [Ktedonosporobacter rubrisoli]|uniref:Amidohydrolase n=1 Tax=Ktedonosporobacter rubrisoli TaxID=2509675 RepID=A0A4P6JWI8_KTERU|nr:hypothetical protein [Ktedonosporobacter rubrisoli]QBD79376.1 hypothetical protein EPA93_26665 [Ktedonosporobacter rubrisoli]
MFPVIDIHAHYYPPAYLEAVRKMVDRPGPVGDAARATIHSPFIGRIPHFSSRLDERIALMGPGGDYSANLELLLA